MTNEKILIIDDEAGIRSSLQGILEDEGYAVKTTATGEEGLEFLGADPYDLVFLDIWLPEMNGIDVLEKIKEQDERIQVVMITGHGSVESAVNATKLGAFNFLEKPLSLEKVVLTAKNALRQKRLEEENIQLHERLVSQLHLVGKSSAVQRLRKEIATAAPSDGRVLLSGENGIGKELVARMLHQRSERRNKRFIQISAAAIPDELIEDELFGHIKDALPHAERDKKGLMLLADGGTLFLDDIGEMSLKTQAKVLRVLEEGEVQKVGSSRIEKVDVRVIAATNKDLKKEIEEGNFREDLYFRLNVVPLHSPALREKQEDIPLLIEYFAGNFAQENNFRVRKFAPAAVEAMMNFPWKGNVRELKNMVERLLIMTEGDTIGTQDLPEYLKGEVDLFMPDVAQVGNLKEFRDLAEKEFILAKLKENDWNISRTARQIDTPRSNLYKKLEQYGIKIKAGVGEAAAPSSPEKETGGEESPNSKGQDGR